jgi:hypothetical protein
LLIVILVFLILNYKEINAQNSDKVKIDLCCTWGSELKDGVLTYNIKKGTNSLPKGNYHHLKNLNLS